MNSIDALVVFGYNRFYDHCFQLPLNLDQKSAIPIQGNVFVFLVCQNLQLAAMNDWTKYPTAFTTDIKFQVTHWLLCPVLK